MVQCSINLRGERLRMVRLAIVCPNLDSLTVDNTWYYTDQLRDLIEPELGLELHDIHRLPLSSLYIRTQSKITFTSLTTSLRLATQNYVNDRTVFPLMRNLRNLTLDISNVLLFDEISSGRYVFRLCDVILFRNIESLQFHGLRNLVWDLAYLEGLPPPFRFDNLQRFILCGGICNEFLRHELLALLYRFGLTKKRFPNLKVLGINNDEYTFAKAENFFRAVYADRGVLFISDSSSDDE